MKKLILISLFGLFGGCTKVYFDQPQPKNAKALNVVPKELRGKWVLDEDTTYITEKGRLDITVYTDSLKKTEVTKEAAYLSDSLILKKAGKFYVINQRDDAGWHITVIKKEKNGDLSWYLPHNYPYFNERHRLKVNKVVLGSGDHRGDSIECKSLKDIKNLDTSDIREVHYKGKLKISDIKKAIVPKNLVYIFKKNGTTELPNDTKSPDTIRFEITIPAKE